MAVVFTPEVVVADRRHHNSAADRRQHNSAVDREHGTNGIAAFGPNPLVGVAAWALSVPLRHVYAVCWRSGFMEIVE